MIRIALPLVLLAAGCGNTSVSDLDMGAGASSVVINELYPHGTGKADPDYAELKNVSDAEVDVGGFKVRDSSLAHLYTIPSGTTIAAGGYLVLYCDDPKDGGVEGIYTGFGLSGKNGDDFHLLGKDGKDLDATTFPSSLASTKSWGRLPDGKGSFLEITPSMGKPNT